MTTRRIWRTTAPSAVKVGRDYSCLNEDDHSESLQSVKHYSQRRIVAAPSRTTVKISKNETGDHRKGRTKLIRSSDHRHPLALRIAKKKGAASPYKPVFTSVA